jgi:hypothetical protein
MISFYNALVDPHDLIITSEDENRALRERNELTITRSP